MFNNDGNCVTIQAVVGETADQVGTDVVGGAVTTNRYPSNGCEDARSLGQTNVGYLKVDVQLVKKRVDGSGYFVCGSAFDLQNDPTESEAKAQLAKRCGYGYYLVYADHEAAVIHGSGGGASGTGYPEYKSGFSSTPEAYNA